MRKVTTVTAAACYSKRAFMPQLVPLIVEWAAAEITRRGIEALVACGHSGLVIAGAVGYAARIPVFAVRKDGEEAHAHSANRVNGVAPDGPVDRWAFLDDFVSSGATLKHSRFAVHDARLTRTNTPVVLLLYNASPWIAQVGVGDEFVPCAVFDHRKLYELEGA